MITARPLFDEASVRCAAMSPSRKLADSRALHWTSLFLGVFESPKTCEPFERSATTDQTLVVVTRGALVLTDSSKRKRRSANRCVGSVSLTPGGERRRLSWHAESDTFETAQIYIPRVTFSEAADELRRAGSRPRTEPLETIALGDPIVGHLCLSLARAHRAGEPDILAASIAAALTVRLLSIQNPGSAYRLGDRTSSRLRGPRLSELLEFMRAHCVRQLSLDQLAAEAGFSRFHFARSFKDAVGVSPHRYLRDARLEIASTMLAQTDSTLDEIARATSFSSAAHLSNAFRDRFAQTPSEYRRSAGRVHGRTSDAYVGLPSEAAG